MDPHLFIIWDKVKDVDEGLEINPRKATIHQVQSKCFFCCFMGHQFVKQETKRDRKPGARHRQLITPARCLEPACIRTGARWVWVAAGSRVWNQTHIISIWIGFISYTKVSYFIKIYQTHHQSLEVIRVITHFMCPDHLLDIVISPGLGLKYGSGRVYKRKRFKFRSRRDSPFKHFKP